MVTTILRLPTVKARTGLSRSTIYLRIAEGRFPAPHFTWWQGRWLDRGRSERLASPTYRGQPQGGAVKAWR